MRQKKNKKALAISSRKVHVFLLYPIINELRRRGWEVKIIHLEKIWEKIESILLKTIKRSSIEFFYKGSEKRIKEKHSIMYEICAKFVFFILKKFKVKMPDILLVLTDSVPPCRIAAMVAKKSEIPSLLLLHSGIISPHYEYSEFVVDKIAVTGNFAKQILIEKGVDEHKIVVTGRPIYDLLIQAKKLFDKDEICNRLGLDPTKKIIVYTTENLPVNETKRLICLIGKTVKHLPEAQLVIKVHPSEFGLSLYKETIKDIGINALIVRDANIFKILYISDIVITGFSSTALDAMVLGKPVITINLTGFKDPVPYVQSNAAIGVYYEKDLLKAIKMGLYDTAIIKKLTDARNRFIYDHAYKLDGKSTMRVAELIEQMVK